MKNSVIHAGEDSEIRFSQHKLIPDGEEQLSGDYKSMNNFYYYTSTLIMFGL